MFYTSWDSGIYEDMIITLNAADSFKASIPLDPNLLSVIGFNVLSVDKCDPNPLPASAQSTWLLYCLQLGNDSSWQYRNNGVNISNVIKVFSRNILNGVTLFIPDCAAKITQQNFTRLDFGIVNNDGTPISVSGTTVAIRFVIRFIKTRFVYLFNKSNNPNATPPINAYVSFEEPSASLIKFVVSFIVCCKRFLSLLICSTKSFFPGSF